MYTKKDICIITTTYNRPKDIDLEIKSLINYKNFAGKHIILDQSKNNETKKVFEKYTNKYSALRYKHFNVASKIISLNNGIDTALKEKYKIICILDDDVEVKKDILSIALREFNSNEEIKGVGAIQIEPLLPYNLLKFKIKNSLLKFFLLPNFGKDTYRILGPYGHNSVLHTNKDLRNCQWMPGFLNFYKAEVFEKYRLPGRIGYEVLSDIDIGYSAFKRNGLGSLVIPKDMRVYHHMSSVERYPNKKRIFVNHEDHITFYYRYFHNLPGFLKLFWELFWINILNLGRAVAIPRKENFLRLSYLWQALFYCFKYRKQIKAGKSRMFLNSDLSMKESF